MIVLALGEILYDPEALRYPLVIISTLVLRTEAVEGGAWMLEKLIKRVDPEERLLLILRLMMLVVLLFIVNTRVLLLLSSPARETRVYIGR